MDIARRRRRRGPTKGGRGALYARVQTLPEDRPYHAASFEPGARVTATTAFDPKLAFVFPGQGSQSVGMLADLAAGNPTIAQTFAEASDGAGVDLWALSQEGPEERLNTTEFTQPALLAAGVATWRLWCEGERVRPGMLAGHSLGEYSALVAAGVLTLGDAARLVRLRGRLMQDAAPAGTGAMAAILGAEDAVVEEVCAAVSGEHIVVPANFNSPGQIVIGGHAAAVDAALAQLAERGVRKAVKLAVSVPSHTPLMREAANRLAEAMTELTWNTPTLPVVQNVDAEVHEGVESIRDALVRQLYLPVRWTECVQALAGQGVTRIAECGPGKVLAGLVKRIDKSIDARALGAQADFDAAASEWSTR